MCGRSAGRGKRRCRAPQVWWWQQARWRYLDPALRRVTWTSNTACATVVNKFSFMRLLLFDNKMAVLSATAAQAGSRLPRTAQQALVHQALWPLSHLATSSRQLVRPQQRPQKHGQPTHFASARVPHCCTRWAVRGGGALCGCWRLAVPFSCNAACLVAP